MMRKDLALMTALLEASYSNSQPTPTGHDLQTIYLDMPPEMPAASLAPKFKSKCKKHRREARGW